MKIALPTRDEQFIDEHFGHCEFYTVYTIDENNKIVSKERLDSPQGCGCKSNIAGVLSEIGVKLMLAGNMGNGAVNVLGFHGIDVVRGCQGKTDEIVNLWLENKVQDSGTSCAGHSHDGGECHNHN